MQLSANKTARYLIQNEYHQVELEHELLIIASTVSEERIHLMFGTVRFELNVA